MFRCGLKLDGHRNWNAIFDDAEEKILSNLHRVLTPQMPPKTSPSKTTKAKASPKKSPTKKAAAAPPKPGKRETTAYQTFMKTELPKVKKENPDLSHREAFSQAAKNWAKSPMNPKKK